ncbi:MAG: glycosyltransferase family 4 protein [Pseudomonadales bacterium]|nr:glycosyltransferase family 4 protein [Pseudomonadales bacterium]
MPTTRGRIKRILVATTLYPNANQNRHGIFVETRLRQLLKSGEVEAQVVAPVPWFPFKIASMEQYSIYADVPKHEQRNGIEVFHPRYLVIPKIGMLLTPIFLAISLFFCARKIKKNGFRFELLDGHYFYPDGVATAVVAKLLKVPYLITARGTDINLISNYKIPGKLIRWAARGAAGNITVSAALKEKLTSLGVAADKVHVLRNGVDAELFVMHDSQKTRKELNLTGTVLVSVGNLVEPKGHALVVQALKQLPDCNLLIVGKGEQLTDLKRIADELNVSDRIQYINEVSQSELAKIYSAADLLILASSREGWPNVLLESMACGTPVLATRVGGTPEIVTAPEAGCLIDERSADSIAAGVKALLQSSPRSEDTRRYAEKFSWKQTITDLVGLLDKILISSSPITAKSQ